MKNKIKEINLDLSLNTLNLNNSSNVIKNKNLTKNIPPSSAKKKISLFKKKNIVKAKIWPKKLLELDKIFLKNIKINSKINIFTVKLAPYSSLNNIKINTTTTPNEISNNFYALNAYGGYINLSSSLKKLSKHKINIKNKLELNNYDLTSLSKKIVLLDTKDSKINSSIILNSSGDSLDSIMSSINGNILIDIDSLKAASDALYSLNLIFKDPFVKIPEKLFQNLNVNIPIVNSNAKIKLMKSDGTINLMGSGNYDIYKDIADIKINIKQNNINYGNLNLYGHINELQKSYDLPKEQLDKLKNQFKQIFNKKIKKNNFFKDNLEKLKKLK